MTQHASPSEQPAPEPTPAAIAKRLRDRLRRRPRRSRPAKRTVAVKRLTREAMAVEALEPGDVELLAERPRTRADCAGGERPCPWVGCRYHLYIDVNPQTGSLILNFPDLEPWELKHTCALDGADQDGMTLEEVGAVMNLTRERIRQVETKGLLRLKRASPTPEELAALETPDVSKQEVQSAHRGSRWK